MEGCRAGVIGNTDGHGLARTGKGDGMDNKVTYRSARQEALRKVLIAKIWATARERGWETEELYDNLGAMGKAREIFLYKWNWVGRGEKSRVSLRTLKNWQLEKVIAALCGERKQSGRAGDGESGGKARILDRKEWAR